MGLVCMSAHSRKILSLWGKGLFIPRYLGRQTLLIVLYAREEKDKCEQ